jgi:hypothetical protein
MVFEVIAIIIVNESTKYTNELTTPPQSSGVSNVMPDLIRHPV